VKGQKSKIGSTRWSPNGYHYTRVAAGWQLTHRVIAEERLGRPLKDNERAKFIDGNRRNIQPENIQVFVTRPQSANKRIATLEAKKAEIDAQLKELYAEETS
jgi:hypothetical protein